MRRLLRYFGSLKGARQPELDRVDRRLARADGALRLGRQEDRRPVEGHGAEGPVHRRGRSNRPELLILDEPFSGLDPVNAEVAQGRRAGAEAGRDHGRLLDPRHGGRRAALRPDLHDLQGARRSSTARSTRSSRSTATTRSASGPTAGDRRARGARRRRSRSTTWATSRRCAGAGTRRTCCAALAGPDADLPLRDRPPVAARHLRPDRRPRPGPELETVSP